MYPAGRAGIRTDIVTLTLELSLTNETKRNGNLFRLLFRRVQRRSLPASFLIQTVNFDLSQLRHACSSYPRLIKEESLLGFIFFLHLLFSHDWSGLGSTSSDRIPHGPVPPRPAFTVYRGGAGQGGSVQPNCHLYIKPCYLIFLKLLNTFEN